MKSCAIAFLVLGLLELASGCADFVFLVDSEVDDSVLGRGIQRRRDLVVKTAQQLDLGSGVHRASVILYGRRPSNQLLVEQFDDSQSTDAFVSRLRAHLDESALRNASLGTVNSFGTARAVQVLLKQVLTRKRMGSPVVVIVFTDGRVRPNEAPLLEQTTTALAKKHYVHTFAVNPESAISVERMATLLALTDGVQKSVITAQNRQVSVEQLLNAAIRPFVTCEQLSKSRVLRRKPNSLPRASVAPSTTTVASTKKSTRTPPTRSTSLRTTTARPGCATDVVFLMDFSGGAVEKREKYLSLAADLVKSMTLGDDATRVAFVRYSGPRRTDSVFHLKKHRDAAAAIAEMQSTPSLGGTTRTGAAMLDAFLEFETKYGGRAGAQRVMVIFTDGYSQDDPVDASAKLYQQRVRVMAVAVDDSQVPPDVEQLKAIATDPKFVFLEKDFPRLKNQFVQSQCK